MTLEELQELYDNQTKQLEDITTERDALKEIQEDNLKTITEQKDEISELKKANYKLVNSLPAGNNKTKTVEENIFELCNK